MLKPSIEILISNKYSCSNSSKFIKYKYQTGRKKKKKILRRLSTGANQLSTGETPGPLHGTQEQQRWNSLFTYWKKMVMRSF